MRTIALRAAADDGTARARLGAELAADFDALTVDDAEAVIRAFTLYFQLVNVAEERARVRGIRGRRRSARGAVTRGSVGEAILRLEAAGADAGELLAHLSIEPVLTAHPTEARRRTALIALRRIERLVERLHDLHLTPEEDGDIRRRLREEITVLWRTADLRSEAPSPLDEVRSALAFFDATLFTAVPRLYRSRGRRTRPAGAGRRRPGRPGQRTDRHRPPRVPAFLQLRLVDRRRPGRQSECDRRGHRPDPAHRERPRPARLRGGLRAAHADGRGGRSGRSPRRAPRGAAA